MGSTLLGNPYYPPEYSLFGITLNSGNRTITQRINREWGCYSKKSLYHSPSTNYHSAIFCNSIMPRIGLYFSQFSSSKFWIMGRITEGANTHIFMRRSFAHSSICSTSSGVTELGVLSAAFIISFFVIFALPVSLLSKAINAASSIMFSISAPE